MACSSTAYPSSYISDEDYYNDETDDEDTLEDSRWVWFGLFSWKGDKRQWNWVFPVKKIHSAAKAEQSCDDSPGGSPHRALWVTLTRPQCILFHPLIWPHVLPPLEQEFTNVHPGIIAHHESDPMSTLQCFLFFFTVILFRHCVPGPTLMLLITAVTILRVTHTDLQVGVSFLIKILFLLLQNHYWAFLFRLLFNFFYYGTIIFFLIIIR